jgi:hypothetical protein
MFTIPTGDKHQLETPTMWSAELRTLKPRLHNKQEPLEDPTQVGTHQFVRLEAQLSKHQLTLVTIATIQSVIQSMRIDPNHSTPDKNLSRNHTTRLSKGFDHQ